jgi:ligand-binding sensor domain-containing protein
VNTPDCEYRRRLLLVPAAIAFSLFLCLGAPVAFGLDPGKATTQYIHEVWQTQDGLPQNSIRAIAQTNDGYLWLRTPAGLVRSMASDLSFSIGATLSRFEITHQPLLRAMMEVCGLARRMGPADARRCLFVTQGEAF